MEDVTHFIIQYNHREKYKGLNIRHEEQTGVLVLKTLYEILKIVTNECYHPVAIFKIKLKP